MKYKTQAQRAREAQNELFWFAIKRASGQVPDLMSLGIEEYAALTAGHDLEEEILDYIDLSTREVRELKDRVALLEQRLRALGGSID